MTERFHFALTQYLADLRKSEGEKSYADRHQIPTVAELVDAVNKRHFPEPRSDGKKRPLHKVTAYNIANGKTATLTYETAYMLICELHYMGFQIDLNKLFHLELPEKANG